MVGGLKPYATPVRREERQLNINNGVKIQSIIDGKMKNAGLTKGFIITHLDKEPIRTKKQLMNYLNLKKGGILVEGLYPNGVKGYFGFGI